MDDVTLLKTVKKSELENLCEQFQLSTKGTKQELLSRLREHAAQQAELERQRQLKRVLRVEEGSDDPKERYEIVEEVIPEDDEEDDAFFYFEIPDTTDATATESKKAKKPTFVTQASVTAPPPPTEPNADGERVVTVYSTMDQNDLTGVAAAQPGQATTAGDTLTNLAGASSTNQPWDMQNSQQSEASPKELEQAKEKVLELVQTLLSMSGAPAFRSFDEDLSDNAPLSADGVVGFNPAKVPTGLLTASSQALRANRGQILQEVLRQFELQAIGQDGMAGDNIEKGGGHYREVSKVRAFLEGYRRAEVRRLARETTALLLDKLLLEGIEGLDLTLATMTRSSDDTSNYAGELNDSLLDFLNDAIRQQEKKVDRMIAAKLEKIPTIAEQDEDDRIEQLWNVTAEDGERVESIDPNDPKVKRVLEEEYQKSLEGPSATPRSEIPSTAPEQLLLLLTLLRERIKTEAAFAPDEKGRNLRLLAYCLRLPTDVEREQLIMRDLGSSLDVSMKKPSDSE